MRTKILGRTGIEVSIVGLGAATLGMPDIAGYGAAICDQARRNGLHGTKVRAGNNHRGAGKAGVTH